MKKCIAALLIALVGAASASASGVGVFGSYLDSKDLGPGFGGGVKFSADLAEYFAIEARASCLTKFDEWDGDDDLFMIPLEAALLFKLPLGEAPVGVYVGGGAGYTIFPEADDLDLDDSFSFFGVGGIEFGMGDSASLFAEAIYRVTDVGGFEIDGEEGDLDEDLEAGGFGVNAGLIFRF
jgi:hypothetical protein